MAAVTVALGVTGAGLVLLIGDRGIRAVLGDEYGGHLHLVLALVGVAVLAGLATNGYYLLVATGRFGSQPVVVLAAMLVAVPVIILGTRSLGMLGTALGMATMYLVQLLVTVAIAKTLYARRPPRKSSTDRHDMNRSSTPHPIGEPSP